MKELRCFCDITTIDGIDYEIICIPEDSNENPCYNFYIQPAAHDYTLREMFGLPADQQTIEEAFAIAIANAPEYAKEFC